MSDGPIARSPEDTFELGRRLAERLGSRGVVWLVGPLGAGKTVLAKGLFSGFGVDPRRVVSPSFSIINRYGLDPLLHHVDLYRIEQAEALRELGLEELVEEPGVVVIEWGERLGDSLGPPDLEVRLEPDPEGARHITLKWRSGRQTPR